ncbi:hypothetical protein [Photorhabdus bodei]|nr:hypothetical protein [Photorhabdus bodei]MDB6374602.1 hypothetical protein [Photorhabdus bodei]
MKTLKCVHNRSLLMPAQKFPALLDTNAGIHTIRYELEQKYSSHMTLDEVCKELGIKPESIVKRIGQLRYRHYALTYQLECARVFKGKNTFFWTEHIARIFVEGNKDEISLFN